MAIDPPYRLDPLQNPVNVKWRDENDPQPNIEGLIGVSIGTVWFFGPGESGVGFPDGPGSLDVRGVGTSGPFSTIQGVWSGGSGSGSIFTNSGDGPFFAIPGGGTSGSFSVVNSSGAPVGGAGSYDYSGLTFIQNNSNRIYTVTGAATEPFFDMSEVAGIPRFVTTRWRLRMLLQG